MRRRMNRMEHNLPHIRIGRTLPHAVRHIPVANFDGRRQFPRPHLADVDPDNGRPVADGIWHVDHVDLRHVEDVNRPASDDLEPSENLNAVCAGEVHGKLCLRVVRDVLHAVIVRIGDFQPVMITRKAESG